MRSIQIFRLVISTKFILHLFWNKFGINVVLPVRPARSRRGPPSPAKLKRRRDSCSWPADAVLVKSEYLKGIEWGEYVDKKRKRGRPTPIRHSHSAPCAHSRATPVRYSVHPVLLCRCPHPTSRWSLPPSPDTPHEAQTMGPLSRLHCDEEMLRGAHVHLRGVHASPTRHARYSAR